MLYTAAIPTSPYQRTTRCQRLGYQHPSPYSSSNVLGVEDLLESLTRVAYEEEIARREKIAADLKRKRLEEQHREELQRQVLVRHFEHDDFFQIEILKQLPSKKNFKSYEIQYLKKRDELLLIVESKVDQFRKEYRFLCCEIDEQRIDYKIMDNRLLLIQVPKRTKTEIDEERVFNFLQHQQDKLNAARIRQHREEQQIRQIREQQLRQEQAKQRKIAQLKKAAEKQRLEREKAERAEREEQLKLQRQRQEALQQYFNSLVHENFMNKDLQSSSPYVTINGIQYGNTEPIVDSESESETESDFDDTLSTPEASDLSDVGDEDPEVSDISQLVEQNTIKEVSSATPSDDESEETDGDDENSSKKRKLRSPLLEEVEDEEFKRWTV